MSQNERQCLDWPGDSPDLNTIENLWGIEKKWLRKVDRGTKEQILCGVIKVWFHDEKVKEICKKLV